MPGYRLTLLGPPSLERAGEPGGRLRLGAKPLGLLAFLALEPGRHTRDELAALLWGDSTKDAARASLRQALRALRAAVGGAVLMERDEVALADGVETDVQAFQRACRDDPARATRLGLPRLLAGFSLPHAPVFEDWLERSRAQLTRECRDRLRDAVRVAKARSRWRQAADAAEGWLACEPLSEEAARHLAEARYMGGDRGGALACLAEYRRRLTAETGDQPGPEIAALVARIGAGIPAGPASADEGETAVPRFEAGLLGREAEWRVLLEIWSAVQVGTSRMALIEGEPGVGKTRLANDFLRWCAAEGATVLRGAGFDPDESVPYAPVAEGLDGALAAPGIAGVAPEWLAEAGRMHPGIRGRFPQLPEPSAPGDTDRRWRLFEGVAQVLLGLAAERPTILCIDDLHLCDASTCALLHFLERRVEAAPVLLLATVTLGDLEQSAPASRFCRSLRAAPRARVITLHPLTVEAVWELIRDLGRLEHPESARRFAARVHAVTDGNPFHIVELLKTLFAQGLLMVDPETGAWAATPAAGVDPSETIALPRTVREAITARFAKLPYELRDLLAATAVSGRGASADLLSFVSGASRLRVAALADALVERRLLAEEGGVYRCAHPVIGDVIRGALTPARRCEMHRALALSLERLGAPENWGETARHAANGGESALAHRAARRAAEWALDRQSPEDAAVWLDLALRTAPTEAERRDTERWSRERLRPGGPNRPPRGRRSGTPGRGLAVRDLDFGTD